MLPSMTRARFVDTLGFTGLLLFAASAWLSTTGTTIALIVMALALLADPKVYRVFPRDPLFQLALIFSAYIALIGHRAILEFPETRSLQIADGISWTKLYWFFLIGWWLKGDARRIDITLLVAFLGLLINAFKYADPKLIASIATGTRTGFHLSTLGFGLIVANILFALLILAPRCWGKSPAKTHIPRIILWCGGVILVNYGLLASGARSAWLALAITTPPLVWIRYRSLFTSHKLVITGLAVILLVWIGAGPGSHLIKSRIGEEHHSISQLASGEYAHLPRTSIGYRVDVQLFGLQKWLEHPWTGWGPGSSGYLIQHSQNPKLIHKDPLGTMWLAHLHNAYLEILVRLGLIGAALLAITLYLLFKSLRLAYLAQRLSPDHNLFFMGSLMMFLVWSFFDFHVLHWDIRNYWLILVGAVYSYRLSDPAYPSPSRPFFPGN